MTTKKMEFGKQTRPCGAGKIKCYLPHNVGNFRSPQSIDSICRGQRFLELGTRIYGRIRVKLDIRKRTMLRPSITFDRS